MEEETEIKQKKKDKNWIQRHPILSVIIGLLILMFLVGNFGNNSKEKIYVCDDGSEVNNPNDCPKVDDEVKEVIEDTEEDTEEEIEEVEAEVTIVELADYERVIKENCEKDWENDFSMRAYCEGQQLDAYDELFDIQPLDVPDDVFNTIKEDCEDDWGYDFSMQIYCIENQIEGWRDIQ